MPNFLCRFFNCHKGVADNVQPNARSITLTKVELKNLSKVSLIGISDMYGLFFDADELDEESIAELILQAYDRQR